MSTGRVFLEDLRSGAVKLADGAMGTMLLAAGITPETSFDFVNITQPEQVGRVHRSYLEAGVDILETNTFGANRAKLAAFRLQDKVAEINQAGVEIARKEIAFSGRDILLAGSVGPLGVNLAPFGRLSAGEAHDIYFEQIKTLVDAGVDLLWIETQVDLYEAREAVRAAKAAGDLPVLVSMTFARDQRTPFGNTPEQVAAELILTGADCIGANCSAGPAQLLEILGRMRAVEPAALMVLAPNAGWPEMSGGRMMYHATPEYFAGYASAFRRAGAQVIGGCCGTTPAHIRAMRDALDRDQSEDSTESFAWVQILNERVEQPEEPRTRLAQKLGAGEFVISVEMDPPRGYSAHKLLTGAHMLAEAGADVINVADSPLARMRMSPWAACRLIEEQVHVETVLHFPTRGRNLLRIQGDLLATHALGLRNLFVVMGDPTAIGDVPDAQDGYDVVPSGLIRLIKQQFNNGLDYSGAYLDGRTSFFAGTALNPGAFDLAREVRTLHRKIEAGADFALTQPVFDPDIFTRFREAYQQAYGTLTLPILAGVLPLYSRRHAEYLDQEVPGIQIPDAVKQRISEAGETSPQAGVDLSLDLIALLRNQVQGLYLMPPFHRYDLVAEIVERVRHTGAGSGDSR
ncbi:MAG: bifunctional homocysteine S-methyltransferase/methylenetetrahydrofolate reductase [Anaerolineales bacterium]|nr:bifunctional homocysteine S-methyltransferase/methylenetetrahydrofolate reductase [Anaerolineales bacterium]